MSNSVVDLAGFQLYKFVNRNLNNESPRKDVYKVEIILIARSKEDAIERNEAFMNSSFKFLNWENEMIIANPISLVDLPYMTTLAYIMKYNDGSINADFTV